MKERLRAGGRRLVERAAPTVMASISEVPALRREIRQLREQLAATRGRVAELEAEMQEARRLNRRIAEVTDLVEEAVLPAADRDDDRLRRALDKYADAL